MAAKYRVKIFDTSDSLVYQTDDYNSLEYNLLQNGVDNHTITFNRGPLEAIEDEVFALDNFVVIERSDPQYGVDWYTDYEGFHRTPQHTTSERGIKLITSYGRSYEDLLNRRHVAYKASSAGANKTGPVETVIKAFVEENCGSLATVANGREVNGVIPGFTVVPSNGTGASIDSSRPWSNVLDVVDDLAKTHGFYFSVTRSGVAFTFEALMTYGTDRSEGSATPVIFSEEFGNMVAPSYLLSRTEEVNRIVVLGQGEDALRDVVIVDDLTAQSNSPWNVIERTHDARNEATAGGLGDEGDQELMASQAKESFTFQILQSDSTRYGLHYFHGDIVTARMHGIQRDKRITGVTVNDSNGVEALSFQFSDEALNPDAITAILEAISKRIRRLEVREAL